MALFKGAAEVFAQGQDLVLRCSFEAALEKFQDASMKFSRQGDTLNARLAESYASVIAIAKNQNNPDSYINSARCLRGIGNAQLKFGLREISASLLADELELEAEERRLLSTTPSTADELMQKGHKLRELAAKYRTIVSGRVLILPELLNRHQISGDSKFPMLMAEAEQSIGQSYVMSDPRSAAEHYQNARMWWMQSGHQELADLASSRTQAYGKTARCWFCDREVSGEGVHFVPMPSDLTDLVKQKAGDSPVPAIDQAGTSVYACAGCHSAIFRTADLQAVRRTQELEQIISRRIEELNKYYSGRLDHLSGEIERMKREISRLGRR